MTAEVNEGAATGGIVAKGKLPTPPDVAASAASRRVQTTRPTVSSAWRPVISSASAT
jgi:hypothetical protein